MKQFGQGAIEYLLLLAAAVVVVAVVVSFMIVILRPTGDVLDQSTLDFNCKTVDANTFICGCYLCDPTKGGYVPELNKAAKANKTDCDALSQQKNSPLIGNTAIRCGTKLP